MIFVFYTIPLTAASKLANPEDLGNLIPKLDGVSDERAVEITLLLSGLITAGIWSLFFALCPILFKVSHFLLHRFYNKDHLSLTFCFAHSTQPDDCELWVRGHQCGER